MVLLRRFFFSKEFWEKNTAMSGVFSKFLKKERRNKSGLLINLALSLFTPSLTSDSTEVKSCRNRHSLIRSKAGGIIHDTMPVVATQFHANFSSLRDTSLRDFLIFRLKRPRLTISAWTLSRIFYAGYGYLWVTVYKSFEIIQTELLLCTVHSKCDVAFWWDCHPLAQGAWRKKANFPVCLKFVEKNSTCLTWRFHPILKLWILRWLTAKLPDSRLQAHLYFPFAVAPNFPRWLLTSNITTFRLNSPPSKSFTSKEFCASLIISSSYI